MKIKWSSIDLSLSVNQLVLAASAFIVLAANQAFFRNLAAQLLGTPGGWLHMASLAVLFFCLTALFVALFSFRRVLKPALVLLFLVSAGAAYFMDTYNVVIEEGMFRNMLATDAAETRDLLTPRLLGYLLLLGVLPALLLTRVRLRHQDVRSAFRARAVLVGGIGLVTAAVVLSSSAFYASFLREQKSLRYYANPLTPAYAVYKHGKAYLSVPPGPVAALGEDALIPEADIDRELVIMVVGETARADRFSLNGYDRLTNPRLEKEAVVSFGLVEACGTSTAVSVPCMFFDGGQKDFSNAAAASSENALDVLSHAGVNVLWRDNNSSSKGVADRVDFEDFRTPENNPVCDDECRDVGMLAGLRDVIEETQGGDILIVLHQMGSHGPAYHKRYPDEFEVFKPGCHSSQLDSCEPEHINNSYDNTILYTDHFLAEVIQFLRSYDESFETAMLYVSDHGESLGEAGLFLHGMPHWMAPEAQTQVPMILWLGKNFHDARLEELERLSGQAFSHDNLFHTLLGAFEVESAVYQPEKDLLHLSRKPALAALVETSKQNALE